MDTAFIQLTNFRPHPTDGRYMVFMFPDKRVAGCFEALLIESKIDFDKEEDAENDPPRILFAIRRVHTERAVHLNYAAHGRFRRPLIDNSFVRWMLILFVAGLVGVALYAYFTYGVQN